MKRYSQEDSRQERLTVVLQNMLLASNKSLAEYNLSQEPVLREGKERLAEKQRTAIALSAGLKELQSELQTKSGQVRCPRRSQEVAGGEILLLRSDRTPCWPCCRPPPRRWRRRART